MADTVEREIWALWFLKLDIRRQLEFAQGLRTIPKPEPDDEITSIVHPIIVDRLRDLRIVWAKDGSKEFARQVRKIEEGRFDETPAVYVPSEYAGRKHGVQGYIDTWYEGEAIMTWARHHERGLLGGRIQKKKRELPPMESIHG